MTVSVVMAYYNRREQFKKTLASIKHYGDPEIIVVDDGSTERIDDLEGFDLVRIEPSQKWWINGGATQFNIGFSYAQGDIIIMQNPECIHVGNILDKVQELTPGNMFSFGCYSLDHHLSYETYNAEYLRQHIYSMPQRIQVAHIGWYNHSIHRPVAYHFCNAILREDLEKIGGFDERFAKGIGFDDDDLVRRIRKAGINITIIDDPFVIHQKHHRTDYGLIWTQRMLNKALFDKTANDPVKPPQNRYYGK